jgi:cardiolipin synthase
VADTHFRLDGPIVGDLEAAFLEDWRFVTGEELRPRPSPPAVDGDALCRVIVDGPNEDFAKLLDVLEGAISVAHSSVSIVTPYFLPPPGLASSLRAAALRGVDVRVVLPERSNLPYVHWATWRMLGPLLDRGVRVMLQPPPFDHTKLFLIDDLYVQIGSANLDARSLRLNFEIAVEVYSESLGAAAARHFEASVGNSREIRRDDLGGRSLAAKVRDSVAWLLYPYL